MEQGQLPILPENTPRQGRSLGGFRHKVQGTVFLHACSQTPLPPPAQQHKSKCVRHTQTVFGQSRSSQTNREAAVQMSRRDLVLDTSSDRTLTPRPYKTSLAWMTTREAAAVVLQRWCRGYLARQRVKKLRAAWLLSEAMRLDELARTKSEEEQRAYAEMHRRIHPHLKADFAILQAELAAWVAMETKRIHAKHLPQTYHQAAMQQLLYKETRLLQAIGRLQQKAQKETKAAAMEATLDKMAAPKPWSLSNGATAFVSTPESMRAGELNQMYREYQQQAKSLRQRAEVLLKVKTAVKELTGGPGAELRQLIDREADMLARGRNEASLSGLRSRATALLLQLLQTATFNPLAASIQSPATKPEKFMYGAWPIPQAA